MESLSLPGETPLSRVEFLVNQWMSPLTGWRKRKLIIDENNNTYTLERAHKKSLFSTFTTATYPLHNASIIDNTTETTPHISTAHPKQSLQFSIETDRCINYLKANTWKDKTAILTKLTEIIQAVKGKTAFSNEFEKYKNEIVKHSTLKSPFDSVIVKFTHYQNLILEMNTKWDDFQTVLNNDSLKSNKHKEEYKDIHFGLCKIKGEMKKQFDDIIEKVYDYKDLVEKGKVPGSNEDVQLSMQKPTTTGFKEDNMYKNNDEGFITHSLNWNQLSIDINNTNAEAETKLQELEASSDEANNGSVEYKKCWFTSTSPLYSHDAGDFTSEIYGGIPTRTALNGKIKCSNSMVKEFIKAFSTKKGSLPIYFNEPITMLQKQCERFTNSTLLKSAAHEPNNARQLCYISAFIIGEIFLSLNRMLKPFNPILGETFEYIDNKNNFRFIGEQVSHIPPISAFFCESLDYSCFGDTRATTSFKILKGALEVTFSNKVHILLKQTNDYYVFNRPTVYMKGFLKGSIYSDYSGTVLIEHSIDKDVKCELTFIEETKNEIGKLDGRIYNKDQIVYLIKGNWNGEVYYTDVNGENKRTLIAIDKSEKYLSNTNENYYLPSYTLNLNAMTRQLKDVVPKYDSRNRPDMREYEQGNVDEAQALKTKIEDKQSLRHKKMEEEKYKYIPKYFVNEYSEQSGDYWYRYNGMYWKERKERRWIGGNDCDIFDI